MRKHGEESLLPDVYWTWHLFCNTVVWKPFRSLLLQNVRGAHKRLNLLKLINNYKQMVKRSVLTVLPDISREPCSFKPYKTIIWIRGRLWMIYSCNLIFSLWLILYRIVVFIVYVMFTPQQWILSFCNKLQWSWSVMSSNSTGFWYNISSLSYSLLLINKLKGDIPLHVPNTIVLLQEKRNISAY